MAQRNTLVSLTSFLAFSLGAYFLLLGIQGVMDYNSTGGQVTRALGNLLGSSTPWLNLAIAILQIISGVVLVLGPFGLIAGGAYKLAHLIVLILWIVFLVWTLFFQSPFDGNKPPALADRSLPGPGDPLRIADQQQPAKPGLSSGRRATPLAGWPEDPQGPPGSPRLGA